MNTLALLVGLNALILVAHLVEEIRNDFFKKFPLGAIPRPVAIVLNILLYAGVLITLYLVYLGSQLGVTLSWVFAILMLSNAVGHLLMMLIKRGYLPGGVTAVMLLPASLWLLWYLRRL